MERIEKRKDLNTLNDRNILNNINILNQLIMAFRLRICRNQTTDLLRNTFHATPVTPPESTIQPLFVLSRTDGKISRRGDLKFLFPKKYHKALNLEFSHNRVADTALQRTQKVDIGMGVQIMGALLQGFQIDTAPVTAALRGAKEISFSFTNIERVSVDVNELGAVLSGKHLDLQNASAKIFLGTESPSEMLLVTDVLSSNMMAINTESTNSQDFKINLDALESAIASADLKVKVKKQQNQSIVFQGEAALTFAFSCIRVYVDGQTGALTLGESIEVRAAREERGLEMAPPKQEYVQLDDDAMTPGFLSWD